MAKGKWAESGSPRKGADSIGGQLFLTGVPGGQVLGKERT